MNYSTYSKLRDERGYNDATVAEKTGIAPSTISDWKNGRTITLSLESAKAIADALEVTLDELVREED